MAAKKMIKKLDPIEVATEHPLMDDEGRNECKYGDQDDGRFHAKQISNDAGKYGPERISGIPPEPKDADATGTICRVCIFGDGRQKSGVHHGRPPS